MIKPILISGIFLVNFTYVSAQSETELPAESTQEKQRKHQIGVNILPLIMNLSSPGDFYAFDSQGRSYIQYKYRANDKWHYKADISVWNDYYGNGYSYNSGVYYLEDNNQQYRLSRYRSSGIAAFRAGTERQLNKFFSIGANIIFGIDKHKYYNFQEEVEYDSTYHHYESVSSVAIERLEQQMFSYGASIDMNLNMPIGERWGMVLRYEPQFMRSVPWKNEYQGNNVYIAGLDKNDLGRHHITFKHNIDLVLAFKL